MRCSLSKEMNAFADQGFPYADYFLAEIEQFMREMNEPELAARVTRMRKPKV